MVCSWELWVFILFLFYCMFEMWDGIQQVSRRDPQRKIMFLLVFGVSLGCEFEFCEWGMLERGGETTQYTVEGERRDFRRRNGKVGKGGKGMSWSPLKSCFLLSYSSLFITQIPLRIPKFGGITL